MTKPEKSQQEDDGLVAQTSFARRVWIAVTIVTVVFVALFVIWNASTIFLVVFAGGLLGVFLHSISKWIHNHTPLSRRVALFVTLAVMLLVLGVAGWFTAPAIADQATQLTPALMDAVDALQTRVDDLPFGGVPSDGAGVVEQLMGAGMDLLSSVTDVFSTAVGFLTNFVVLLFVGLYFAYNPKIYVNGVIALIPKRRRPLIRDLIEEVYTSLRWWLVGRLAAMLILGILSTVGLLILDIPLALVLGAMVGFFEFIPYIGPLLSLGPAVLIAYGQSSSQALYVLILYGGLQILESYILTPIIEKRVVSLPPVLLIGSQLTLGAVFGFWGLLLAPALVVTGLVVVKKLYVEGVLGDHSVTYISDERENDGA